jgi:hypothetical protein
MRITFLCRRCYRECQAQPQEKGNPVSCRSCSTVQALRFTQAHLTRNRVDRCAVCGLGDFYVREDPRKLAGLAYLLLGLGLAYWTYGISLVPGLLGFDRHFRKFPKLTICYHCYAKYRDCRPAPDHKQYDLQVAERLEKEIRNDRTLRDFS